MLKDMSYCHLGKIYQTNTGDNYWTLLQGHTAKKKKKKKKKKKERKDIFH